MLLCRESLGSPFFRQVSRSEFRGAAGSCCFIPAHRVTLIDPFVACGRNEVGSGGLRRLSAFLSQQFLEDSNAFVYVFFLQQEWG